MATINKNYDKLAAGYLFPEIARRTKEFVANNFGVEVMRLGIGNTTEPLAPSVIKALHLGVDKLADPKTYAGYGDEQGETVLREAIAKDYEKRGIKIDPLEVFISDGAKPDSANIQSIFGLEDIVAVQDPAYPVYVDTNVIAGRTGKFDKKTGKYKGIIYMPCNEENRFIPEIPKTWLGKLLMKDLFIGQTFINDSDVMKKMDLIYLCSPNNPTGAVMSHQDLQKFVSYAIQKKAVIIFDAAYSAFISKNSTLPRSIYEIDGADRCAIEIQSFSKSAGFTGVRLGWSILPKNLVVKGTKQGKLNALWNRRYTTFFNGASNIVQSGGLAIYTDVEKKAALASLTPEGAEESQKVVDYYMQNAEIIKEGLDAKGIKYFGGDNAPYIWMKTPGGMKSWEFFDKLLNEAHVVGTPGSGFGPSGEGYFRLSSFGHKENIEKAVESILKNLKL